MQLACSQSPIELKAPDPESPLRKLVRLYFAYAWAAGRRSCVEGRQSSRPERDRTNPARVAAYLVRA